MKMTIKMGATPIVTLRQKIQFLIYETYKIPKSNEPI